MTHRGTWSAPPLSVDPQGSCRPLARDAAPHRENPHHRVLLHTLARHERDAALTLAWRSIFGAGFALPRDAGLEAGGPSNRAEPPLPSAQAGEEVGLVFRRGCRFENDLR